MKERRAVTSSPKSGKRKWVRHERKYSNALWHAGWHVMTDPRFRGLNLVAYLDDSSRCVTGAALFKEATSENAVAVLGYAIQRFGAPCAILSDNGPCFVGAGGRRGPGRRTPTPFESELADRGIEMANPESCHPRTGGKLGRFHGTVESEIFHYESLSAYVEYYNERRLHFSLDIKNRQTPLKAFSERGAAKAIRRSNPEWMKEDIDD